MFFFTSHGGVKAVNQFIDIWPNARIITLTNSEKFWNVAINLKQQNTTSPKFSDYAGNDCRSKYQFIKGKDWPDWNEFEQVGYDISKCSNVTATIRQEIEQFYPLQTAKNQVLFNIDDCMFDTDRFLDSMKKLYVQLGFDDFQQDLVKQYYTAYISLHI